MKRGLSLIVLALFVIFPICYAGTLKVTQEHPFLVNGEWIEASELQVGDKLTTSDGKTAVIKNIRDIQETTDVFNLEASAFSNFVLEDGIIVHNSNSFCAGCIYEKSCEAFGTCGGPYPLQVTYVRHYTNDVRFNRMMGERVLNPRSDVFYTIRWLGNEEVNSVLSSLPPEVRSFARASYGFGPGGEKSWSDVGLGEAICRQVTNGRPTAYSLEIPASRINPSTTIVRDASLYSPQAVKKYIEPDLFFDLRIEVINEGTTARAGIDQEVLVRYFNFGLAMAKPSKIPVRIPAQSKVFYSRILQKHPYSSSYYKTMIGEMAVNYVKSSKLLKDYTFGEYSAPEFLITEPIRVDSSVRVKENTPCGAGICLSGQ